MKKLSEINEGVFRNSIIRTSGTGMKRREDSSEGTITCLGNYLNIKDSNCKYDEIISWLINGDDDLKLSICELKYMRLSPEEISNVRNFKARYDFMIYEGIHNSDLVASFVSYSDILIDIDEHFDETVSEEDYDSICRCVADSLKNIGKYLDSVPSGNWEFPRGKWGSNNYSGEYVLKLADESDVSYWAYENEFDENDNPLEYFYQDLTSSFKELEEYRLILWSYRDDVNIGLPLDVTIVANAEKYVKFAENYFK